MDDVQELDIIVEELEIPYPRLNPEDLRDISKSFINNKNTTEKKVPPLSKETIDFHISTMEKNIVSFAQQGSYKVSWDFGKIGCSVENIHLIASEFKQRHPKLMITVNSASKVIKIDWKKNKG